MDLLKSLGMSNLPGVKQAQPQTFQGGFQGGFQVPPPPPAPPSCCCGTDSAVSCHCMWAQACGHNGHSSLSDAVLG